MLGIGVLDSTPSLKRTEKFKQLDPAAILVHNVHIWGDVFPTPQPRLTSGDQSRLAG